MSAEIKIDAEKLYSITSMAKKVSGSVVTVDSKGMIMSINGIWVIMKTNTVCNGNTSISFSSNLPLAIIKKMCGDITISENGSECIFTGTSKTGEAVTAKGEIKCLDAIPDNTERNNIGEINSTAFTELLSMKLSSNLPTYMMFSKKSAVSFILNSCNAGLTKTVGNFSSPLKTALSKETAARLYTILSALKRELSFTMETFSCWDSAYIRLYSNYGMTVIVETASVLVPALPKQFTHPPVHIEIDSSELKGNLVSKPAVTDRVQIGKGSVKTTVMAASIKPITGVIDLSTGIVTLSVSDCFTYFAKNNKMFIVGNAKG